MLKLSFFRKKLNYPAIRYWLFWVLFVAVLAYGAHRYFEYRNMELDKRLELKAAQTNELDLSALNPGLYLVRISTDAGTITRRIIKQ